MINKFFKSPINYLGNKNRILKDIYDTFPDGINNIVDVFTGSGTVSINSVASNLYLNDLDTYMIKFLEIFYEMDTNMINDNILKIVKKYNLIYNENIKDKYLLSQTNKESFLKLRSSFNADKNIFKLFVLILYSFNNQIRFNLKGEYNIPVGKSVYNENVANKIKNFTYAIKTKKCNFFNLHFSDFVKKILELNLNKDETIFYFDPPYLITLATYNSNWNMEKELELLEILRLLDKNGYKFILSNVLESNGKKNETLIKWIKSYNYFYKEMNVNYKNSNYQRKNKGKTLEVLIKNF